MARQRSLFVNSTSLGLSMSLWLSHDQYDYSPVEAQGFTDPVISATTLIKPTRMLVLSQRNKVTMPPANLVDQGAARIGQDIHTGVELAFNRPDRAEIMRELGFSENIIKNMVINPTEADFAANPKLFPIYLEKRGYRSVTLSNGQTIIISGKFDQVLGGSVEDNKTTKAYSYIKMDPREKSDYAVQQSIYRWINPKIITADIGRVNFIFTDWKAGDVSRIDNYPPYQVMEMPVNLMSLEDTETFIINKLEEILAQSLLNEDVMMECPEDQLWKSPDKHKYYANPEVAKRGGRATKNFDSALAAQNHKATKGKGVVMSVPGEVRRCGYCDGAALCNQRLKYA